MQKTVNQVLSGATTAYLDKLDPENLPDPMSLENGLLLACETDISVENKARQKTFLKAKSANSMAVPAMIPVPQSLAPFQIAEVLIRFHHVIRISPSTKSSDPDYDILAAYCDHGPDEGVYMTADSQLRALARQYNRRLNKKETDELFMILREEAPRRTQCDNRDLIAVENGIFDYSTKELLPFDPEYVFLSKTSVPYHPDAVSPVFLTPDGDEWEVEEWMNTLSDDPEVVELLWEVIGAMVRPHVRWGKAAFFYSEVGNNGKGTLTELMCKLLGEGRYATIPLVDLGKDFMLEPLTRANGIIVNENDVGTYIDKAANLKAIITNDVIMINRKNKVPISHQVWGFMVQCLNEMPKVKDRSESFYRRCTFIPFEKSFTGQERKYIKDEYVSHPDVLQYVLKRVLHMNYYTLSEPTATLRILEEFKLNNDSARGFWEEHRELFAWDLVPFTFMYDLYKAWFAKNSPGGGVLGRNKFINDLLPIINKDAEWDCPSKAARHRVGHSMDGPEPLIAAYDLKDWMNPAYQNKSGGNPDAVCLPVLADFYSGVTRRRPRLTTASPAAGAVPVFDPVDTDPGINPFADPSLKGETP